MIEEINEILEDLNINEIEYLIEYIVSYYNFMYYNVRGAIKINTD